MFLETKTKIWRMHILLNGYQCCKSDKGWISRDKDVYLTTKDTNIMTGYMPKFKFIENKKYIATTIKLTANKLSFLMFY